jgi:hypothetical protein
MARAQIALIIPLGDAPGHIPGYPDQGLPGGGAYPDQGLPGGGAYPDQGLPGAPPGYWGGVAPPYPGQGLPGRPPHVGNRPPGSWSPEYPSTGPVRPGRPVDPSWGIEEGGPAHPDQGLPPGPAHPWVPPEGETLPPPPDDIVDQVVLAIWSPSSASWTVKTAPPVHPAPHG